MRRHTRARVLPPPPFFVERLERVLATKREEHPTLAAGPATLDMIASVCRLERIVLTRTTMAGALFGRARSARRCHEVFVNMAAPRRLHAWIAAHQLAHLWLQPWIRDHRCSGIVLHRAGRAQSMRGLGVDAVDEYEADWFAARLVAGPPAPCAAVAREGR